MLMFKLTWEWEGLILCLPPFANQNWKTTQQNSTPLHLSDLYLPSFIIHLLFVCALHFVWSMHLPSIFYLQISLSLSLSLYLVCVTWPWRVMSRGICSTCFYCQLPPWHVPKASVSSITVGAGTAKICVTVREL